MWEGQRAILAVLPGPELVNYARLAIRLERDDGAWTVSSKTHPLRVHSLYSKSSPVKVREFAETALETGRIFRAFPSINDVRVGSNGIGLWKGRTHFGLGKRTSNLSWSQTRNLVERLLKRPDSDLCFARQFHRAGNSEQSAKLFGCVDVASYNGLQGELNRLARCVIQGEPDVWREREQVLWMIRARQNFLALPTANGYHNRTELLTPRLQLWARLLRDFGPLRPRLDHLCLRYLWQNHTLVRVEVEAPTFHEQLEARLELRAWAKAHLPPDVQMELERLES